MANAEPLVSLIMPVYKVEKYIRASVESVIAQTYKNIDFIMVDDGSPDKSIDIAVDVLQKNNFKYTLIRQTNSGQGMARNTGMKAAKGEWTVFLDADDILMPESIRILFDCIAGSDTDIVFSKYKLIYSSDETSYLFDSNPRVFSSRDMAFEFLLRKKVMLVAGTLFRTEMLRSNNLTFEKIPWSEDQHFVWKAIRAAREIVFCDNELYLYLQHDGSIMSSTGADKIIESYPAVLNVAKDFDDDLISKLLAPRWVLGTLNAAAFLMPLSEWKRLYDAIDGKKNMRALKSFPELKIKIAAFIAGNMKSFYYFLNKKRK